MWETRFLFSFFEDYDPDVVSVGVSVDEIKELGKREKGEQEEIEEREREEERNETK